jgi:hypothetical protein
VSESRHFILSSPVVGNVVLNWSRNPIGDLKSYATAYKNAAQALVATVDEILGCHPDHRALPILFLYRHASELYLKTLAYWAAKVLKDPEREKMLPRLWRTHSISVLLSTVTSSVEALGRKMPSGLRLVPSEVGDLLIELDRLDASSDAFRYPVTPQGHASLPASVVINIPRFAEQMDIALDVLSSACHWLEKTYSHESCRPS